MSNIETRKAGALRIEQTEPQPGEPLRLNGIAANWERYDMGNTYERLEPTCFDASIKADGDKIALLWNHDTAKPMGRVSAGNLKVYADRSGLCFECDLPDTERGSARAGACRHRDAVLIWLHLPKGNLRATCQGRNQRHASRATCQTS